MIQYIAGILSREVQTLRREIEAYPDDASPWKEVPGLSNTGGTLALHLAGNLRHYVGSRLGGTGYIRNRPAEFSRRGVGRAALIEDIDAAADAVRETLARLTDDDLAGTFPETFDGMSFDTGDYLIHLAAHLNYHIGQMDYHRRVVTGGGSVGAVPQKQLVSARLEGAPKTSPPAEPPVFDLEEGIAVLERTPRVLRALLEGLPGAWITANEGPKTWSPFDVVGHLIDGEEHDWIARARIILEEGPARTFDPFNRFGHLTANRGKPLSELLGRFESLRAKNVNALRGFGLAADRLDAQGTHPDFGAVTLRQLLATWVVHDLGHIAQITRTMAGRYRSDVGPWLVYLPVLPARKKSG